MKVWLTRKHAQRIDGIDLRNYTVGDTLELQNGDARILLAEEWAKPERRKTQQSTRKRRRASDQR
jgi:hypothetical protein